MAKATRDLEAVDDVPHNAGSSSNSNVLVAARAVLIQLKPVLNAPLAKELVAVVTLLGFSRDLEADLAENEATELLGYSIDGDRLRVV